MVAALLVTYVPRARRLVFVTTAIANAVWGLVSADIARSWDAPVGAMGGVVINVFFAFAIFRLPVRLGFPAAMVGVGYYAWIVMSGHTPRPLTTPELGFIVVLASIAVLTGIFTGLVLERVAHNTYRQEHIIERQRVALEEERARADRLLHNVLPEAIAARLKVAPGVIADHFDHVTVLFADVVGFTPMAAALTPEKLVEVLNEVFTRFDALATKHGVEKIKTIGDAYMAVAGIPQPRADHAGAVAELALDMRAALDELRAKSGFPIRLRIGLCSGPAVAGVIGTHKFAYDLWGDTVNTAARMESHGSPDCIHVSETTFAALGPAYRLTERGVVEIKGKGPMKTWFLEGRA
jgi:class 3 adenylate cyclase